MIPQLKAGDDIESKIETIAFGGEGILRHQGFVVFVPFTVPGELISCRITEVKKSFAKGELIKVLQPSIHRVNPPCPYFGTCGGCQIQHLDDETQLQYKQNAVIDTLKRIGHLEVKSTTAIPAHLKWAYRRHVTLHLRPYENAFEAGYIAIDNRSLVVIQTCPIFNVSTDPVMRQLQSFVKQLPNPTKQTGQVMVLKKGENRYILSFHFPPAFRLDESLLKSLLKQYPEFVGLMATTPKQKIVLGDLFSEIHLEGLIFKFTPEAFVQNHPEQSANIYRCICNLTDTNQKKTIWDLYCGFGMTSLLLSKQGHSVIGVEYNSESIRFAKANAQLNGLTTSFIQGDVEKVLPKLRKESQADLIVLNPPRTGLTKGILDSLLAAEPEEMIYVSCMPSTLARDLTVLCQKTYQIQHCFIYDMFPQTAHVETLIHLTKI